MVLRVDNLETLRGLYANHADFVRNIVRSRAVPEASVEDVVHDVFIVAYRRLSERDPDLSARMWLLAIARNVTYSHRRGAARRARRMAAMEGDVEFDSRPMGSELPTFDDFVDARRVWRILRAFLADLNPDQSETFVVCGLHGVPAKELAASLGCSENTVHSRLRLARRRFAARFPGVRDLGDYEAIITAARAGSTTDRDRREQWLVLAGKLSVLTKASVTTAIASIGGGTVAVGAVALWVFVGRPTEDIPSADHSRAAQTLLPSPLDSAEPVREQIEVPMVPEPAMAKAEPRTLRRPMAANEPDPEPDPAGSAVTKNTLSIESHMLADAKRELRAGRPDSALVWVNRHAQEFPMGVLAKERLRLEVDVLCAMGRVTEASRMATGLTDGIEARSIDRPCPTEIDVQ